MADEQDPYLPSSFSLNNNFRFYEFTPVGTRASGMSGKLILFLAALLILGGWLAYSNIDNFIYGDAINMAIDQAKKDGLKGDASYSVLATKSFPDEKRVIILVQQQGDEKYGKLYCAMIFPNNMGLRQDSGSYGMPYVSDFAQNSLIGAEQWCGWGE